MDWDDLSPKSKTPAGAIEVGQTLETLSVAELEQRISALKAEIARVEAELAKKKAHEAAAAALFKR